MTDERDDLALEAARTRLSVIAHGLVFRFGSDLAAASLAGALVGVVAEAHGREAAARWLHELAAEIGSDDGAPTTCGHA